MVSNINLHLYTPAARFIWASGGSSAGTGLKSLDFESDWLEQASGPEWARQMRLRHDLISEDCGCTIWDDAASEVWRRRCRLTVFVLCTRCVLVC